jgi:hypothetical protein
MGCHTLLTTTLFLFSQPSAAHSLRSVHSSAALRLRYRARLISCSEDLPQTQQQIPQKQRLPTVIALAPLFITQAIGAQFFVPVYLPLLALAGATEDCIIGTPGAAALGSATAIYVIAGLFLHSAPGQLAVVGCVGIACASLLALLEPAESGVGSFPKPEAGGSGVAREDRGLLLLLTLGLSLFLTASGQQISSLRGW